MTESIETERAPAPPSPEPPAPRTPIAFGRAMAGTALLVALALVVAWMAAPSACAILVVAYAWACAKQGVLRSPVLVMAEVTWLVLALLLKLVFLDVLPATPIPVLAAMLGIRYLEQLAVDLRAFATAGDTTPPVTYTVTFALVPAVAVGAELFRAA